MKKTIIILSLIFFIKNICFSQNYCLQSGTRIFTLNATGQAGGIIFYDKGAFTNGWRFLERSPISITSTVGWGCNGTLLPGAFSQNIGTGYQNTQNILNSCTTAGILARQCDNYNLNGFSDWYMPSSLELFQIGGWGTWFYQSSSQYNAGAAYEINSAGNLTWTAGNKSLNNYRTYAIRNVSLNQGTNKSITSVQFNSINKNSTKNSGYDNYSSTDSTKVMPNHIYTLSVKVTTAGTDTVFVTTYFDWNQDGDFLDSSETKYLGSAYNVVNGNTSISGLSVQIPEFAKYGVSKMRIIAKKNGYALPCESNFDGEVEDYKITISPQVTGKVFHDNLISNCFKESLESGINGRHLIITPGNIVVTTDSQGNWNLGSLPIGNYVITLDTFANAWTTNCGITRLFSVTNINTHTIVPEIGIISSFICNSPEISIYAPFLRRCFANQIIYVEACNDITASSAQMSNSFADITLSNYLNVQNSSIPFTNIGNNKYRFQLGNINPGQCINFTIATNVSCNAPNGMTLCMEAELFPADSCVFDTIPNPPSPDNPILPGGGTFQPCSLPWDKSSLSVDGFCQNDTVCFTITNTGQPVGGDMECYSPVRIYVDGVLTYFDSIMIAGGQTVSYCYPGNGQTWILQADQHPLHPGNSHPNAHVEACGNTANWTPGGVNTFPLDDADPIKDIYCATVTGSYDPNDKTGYPLGLGTQNYIHPNQQLQYVIRFQNTGNDTAFTVVIRDTLDINLNIFSLVPGVSSHPYQFKMYGPRILEWTFNNIMLPDSNVNEPASNGFVTFIVEQVPNLSNGSVINNDADIYFDFNAPITTNETKHTINDATQSNPVVTNLYELDTNINKVIKIYPNPTSASFKYEITGDDSNRTISIYDFTGKKIYDGKTSHKSGTIDCSSFNSGIYYLIIDDGINILKQKIVIIN